MSLEIIQSNPSIKPSETNLTGNWTKTPWYFTIFGFSPKRRKIFHSSNHELYVWEYQ